MIFKNNICRTAVTCLLIGGLLSAGCKKMLDVDSTRVVSEENMWVNMEDSRAALMGIYGLIRAALADHNAYWVYGDVRGGAFTATTRQDLKAIIANDLTSSYPTIQAMSNWRRWYAVVNAANVFLERIPEVRQNDPRYSENNMTVDIAQARFLRAFAYFYMVRIWGDVPLIISSHDGQFENKARENQDRILSWAEQEMLAAAADLPYAYSRDDEQQLGNYYNETGERWMGALARKLTAYAFLAHLAAWQGNYPEVATYTKFIVDNADRGRLGYTSTSDLTNADGFFYNKRDNHLFGFNFDWGHVDASFSGHLEELTLAAPVVNKNIPDIYLTKDSILSVFDEPDDQRFSLDTLGNPIYDNYFTNFNGRYPIFSKIKCIMGGSTSDPSFRIFSSAIVLTRLEDMVLLRAEALAALGESSAAIDNLNIIRELRGLGFYNQTVSGNLIDAIFKERNRELMGEGHRWYDLVRYHRIRANDPNFSRLIAEGGIYWPIDRSLLQQNNQLEQNPYWR